MLKSKPILEESIMELYSSISSSSFPECIRMADLGCSSGRNTLLLVRQTIDTIDLLCRQNLNLKLPTFQVFLNDLPGNDFNTIFRSPPSFYDQLCKEERREVDICFIVAMPGSFYGRLFPPHFLHFVHSSYYSLHWLSQVPEGLVSEETGTPPNKGNIYIAKTSPSSVLKAYLDSFERDFTLFLRSRSAELVPGGLMVLTMVGSDKKADYNRCTVWELLGITIQDMALEGLMEESRLDSLNLPYYAPTVEEARQVIEAEGLFNIRRHETFRVE